MFCLLLSAPEDFVGLFLSVSYPVHDLSLFDNFPLCLCFQAIFTCFLACFLLYFLFLAAFSYVNVIFAPICYPPRFPTRCRCLPSFPLSLAVPRSFDNFPPTPWKSTQSLAVDAPRLFFLSFFRNVRFSSKGFLLVFAPPLPA